MKPLNIWDTLKVPLYLSAYSIPSHTQILKALPPGGNWKHYFLILFPNLLNGILSFTENAKNV
jgi:hypothetical protein